MMITIRDKLRHLGFADADFELIDNSDGLGPVIARWRSSQPRPNQAAIDAVTSGQAGATVPAFQLEAELAKSNALRALLFAVADELPGVNRTQFEASVLAIYERL